MGLLDGKVAIITGAGGGIGRCHALLFAQEGAKVVVNDLGGARDGTGGDEAMADKVVAEIREAGGEAVANYASVASMEGAQSIVQTAIDTYGRADILVNNAGILRDKTLLKMDEGMWDLVIAVHLKGSFACGQAFAAHVKQRAEAGDKGGKIINTSSYAGLMGNYGQTNYAAAKAGIYGLTKVWSMELAKIGVQVNCIAPMAKTRMTTDIAMVPDHMKAEHISPMVLFLASSLSDDLSGKIYGIHGQQLLEYKMLMTDGVTKSGEDLWTPAEIAEKLEAIGREHEPPPAAAGAAPKPLTDAEVIAKAFTRLPEVFLPERAKGWNAEIVFDIDGGDPWTISIKDGTCTTSKGKGASPTCVVSVAAKTYADIVKGKEKPEKAFMAGKIKATNLGDMMKFGTAFDMKKAKAMAEAEAAALQAAAPAAAAPKPLTDADVIAKAFQRMPEVFVPERAKGWNAEIVFDIQGGDPWTVSVKDGACTTSKGKGGSPTCVVTVDAKTYADIVKGKEKAEKAFMAGKIKATNLGDMMKFGGAFDMKKAKALAEAEAAAAAPAAAPAAKKELTAGEIIDQAFSLLPDVFVPERAKGWNAEIVFDIQGANPWTVSVKDGNCTTSKGKADSPTCVVTVDKDTYAKIVKGEEKPEKAFMAGKIKATNLGDMMKFGAAFDMKKAKEIAKQHKAAAAAPAPASGGGAPSGPAQQVAAAFGVLPQAFKADAVSGWSTVIQFEIEGGDDWTVTVKDGVCTTAQGKQGEATCVVKTKLEDYARIVAGELRAEQAFMQRKITASNLGEMMKFGRAFDMHKAKELMDSGAAPAAPASGGMNRDCIGNTFTGEEPLFIRPEHAHLFAEATQDSNASYTETGAGTVVPPMLAVRYLKDVMFKTVANEDLGADVLNLVHGEQDMTFHKPLRQWDLCATRSQITGIEDKSTGQLLRLTETLLVDGEPAVDVSASCFIRDVTKKKSKGGAKAEAAPAEEREIAFSQQVTVADDQGPRYAEAGLDNNPIHTDDAVAKLAGFPGIILQGLCTMSFASKAVIDELLGGDSTRLRRLAVRFSKPVLMGDVLTTEGWSLDEKEGLKVYGFHVKNQKGEEVITGGVAEIRE